jgi:hypothetical protein
VWGLGVWGSGGSGRECKLEVKGIEIYINCSKPVLLINKDWRVLSQRGKMKAGDGLVLGLNVEPQLRLNASGEQVPRAQHREAAICTTYD